MKDKNSFKTFEDYFTIQNNLEDYSKLQDEELELNNFLSSSYEKLSGPRLSIRDDFYNETIDNTHTKVSVFLTKSFKDINKDRYNIESNTSLSVSSKVTLLKFLERNTISQIDVKRFKNSNITFDPFMRLNGRLRIYNLSSNIINNTKGIIAEPINTINFGDDIENVIKNLKMLNYTIKDISDCSLSTYSSIIDIKSSFENRISNSLDKLSYSVNDVFKISKEVLNLEEKIKQSSSTLFSLFNNDNKKSLMDIINYNNPFDKVNGKEAISLRLKKLAFLVNLQHSILGYSFIEDVEDVKKLCDTTTKSSK